MRNYGEEIDKPKIFICVKIYAEKKLLYSKVNHEIFKA